MKSRDTLVRLKRFQAEERRRRLVQIEAMVAEFSRMAADLDREIAAEEQRSGNANPTHFAYSTYARAARARRDNLTNSVEELRGQIEEARAAHGEALEEVAKAQSLEGREKGERVIDVVRERLDANMIGLRPAGA